MATKGKHNTMADEVQAPKNNFFLSINGEIESAVFPFYQDIYCKYTLVSGPDWILASVNLKKISHKKPHSPLFYSFRAPMKAFPK